MIKILYIDPSVMTYSIQVITGAVISLSAGIGIFVKKIVGKKKNKSKKKTVESDDIFIK